MSVTFGRVTSGDWYLGIDLGTGGVQVAAVDRDGAVLLSGFSPIETELRSGGGAVQDTASWWDGIGTCTRSITRSGSVDPARCRGIGITGQWGSTIPVDIAGHAVGPCLLWSDDRGAQWPAAITGGPVRVSGFDPRKLAKWIRLTGGAPSPGGADPTGHAQSLRHRMPDVYAQAHALVEPVDFVAARLTGRVEATPASMVASWLTDNRVGAAPVYVPTLIELAGRDPAKLPTLLPTGAKLGGLRPDVAKQCTQMIRAQMICPPTIRSLLRQKWFRRAPGGVIFAPWLKGERSPVDDRHLRGSFVNVSLATTRVSMARAVLEGVAYNARWLLEAKFAGRPLDGLRILGGGAQVGAVVPDPCRRHRPTHRAVRRCGERERTRCGVACRPQPRPPHTRRAPRGAARGEDVSARR